MGKKQGCRSGASKKILFNEPESLLGTRGTSVVDGRRTSTALNYSSRYRTFRKFTTRLV
jgi:hypothetical protein